MATNSSMKREHWRAVPSAPGYMVSDRARIYSPTSHRIFPGYMSDSGYRYAEVTVEDGTRKRRTVHSLVCEAFHGPRPEGMEVRHLDGNPLNNTPKNLAWGTPSQNRLDSVRHGTHRMVGTAKPAPGRLWWLMAPDDPRRCGNTATRPPQPEQASV